MSSFQVFLIGNSNPAKIMFGANSIEHLGDEIGRTRFLRGRLIDYVDADGVCSEPCVLIPTSRIQMVIEGDD